MTARCTIPLSVFPFPLPTPSPPQTHTHNALPTCGPHHPCCAGTAATHRVRTKLLCRTRLGLPCVYLCKRTGAAAGAAGAAEVERQALSCTCTPFPDGQHMRNAGRLQCTGGLPLSCDRSCTWCDEQRLTPPWTCVCMNRHQGERTIYGLTTTCCI